jgi:succinyl-CoA synthetase alpha subunit
MDLLEYQGKQLFRKHGVPTPEEAADFIAEHVSKPVLAYIAGFTAPPGKTQVAEIANEMLAARV